ncbi:hypothetical protein Vafri_16397 [Volvox africanus]|uniref:Trimethylguanosine synthase n=1 Tax=Volvox africanus TaxID=51714 RepID=A0A8J4F5M1_9CHLO|nr:hypothetical protein Vafri_16397 [Volvox africanus]
MARQVLIDKWNGAQDVRLSTALDLDLSDTTLYRLGRLVITSVRLHDVGLVGGKEPVNASSEAPSDTEASSLSAELASLGLPTAFGKKGSSRREGRTPGGSLKSSRLAHKGEHQSGSRKGSLGGVHDSGGVAGSHPNTPWLRGFDEQWGCHYYYNTKTKESVWEAPAEGFVPWEEAAEVADGEDEEAQRDVQEFGIAADQLQQLTPDSGNVAGAAGSSSLLSGAVAGRIPGAERDAATGAAAPPGGEAESGAPGPAPRMLTEEDLLREMGLWQDNEAPQSGGGLRSQAGVAAASAAPPPALTQAMGAGGGAADEPFGAGAGAGELFQGAAAGAAAGGDCIGAEILVNLLRSSTSQLQKQQQQQPSPVARTLTPQRVVPPPTALSEEQLLARLSLSKSLLTPMPPPPTAPAPPPPSPPPPPAVAHTDSVSGAAASAPSSDATSVAEAPPRMLTEEDILRSMGLLPASPELGGGRTAVKEPRAASALAQASSPGHKPPPPPGFSPVQGPAAVPANDGSPKASEFDGFQPQPPSQQQQHGGDHPPPYPIHLQPNQETYPHAGQQAVQYSPLAPPGSGAAPRMHLPHGFHSVLHPQSLYVHDMSHHPHRRPHLPGPPGEFPHPGLPQPLPFNHGSAAGVPHMGFGLPLPPPPPGFGHPPPFPPPLPPPVDMWPHSGGPFGPPLMPVIPPPPSSPPPPGFGLPHAGPAMPYGPLPYPYGGHPYPPYEIPPYGLPPRRPAPAPLPPPFVMGGYPPGPVPQPSSAGMTLDGGLVPPPQQHHHALQPQAGSHLRHDEHYQPQQQQQQQLEHRNLHNEQQQQQQQQQPSPASQTCVDADIVASGQPSAGKGPDVNRRAVTWTLEELERQFEIMAGTVTAAEDDGAPAVATPAGQRQEVREGAEAGLKGPGHAENRQGRQKGGNNKAQQQHVVRHPGAAAGRRRTGNGRSNGGTTEASSVDNNDDDSAFYDTFANGAITAAAAAIAQTATHLSQRVGTAAKPVVGEDDGTRRVALDPRTAAYVRTLLPRSAAKYWMQRYSLFSRFDSAVRLDTEGWWSVTPEVLAAHQAERSKEMCARGLVAMDACCGCGGNLIQMAGFFAMVLGVEISPKRVEMARHNAGQCSVWRRNDPVRLDRCAGCLSALSSLGAVRSPMHAGP